MAYPPENSMPADVMELLRRDRVAAVLRAPTITDPLCLADGLLAGGVRCIELTFTSDNVLEAVRALSDAGVAVGVGTVVHAAQAAAAIEAGARFVVSPGLRAAIGPVCAEAGVPLILGALTPTEILAAVEAGASAVKIFPASVGGPGYVVSLRGPFPDIPLMPSGGVSSANAAAFLAAGSTAVFVGSELAAQAEIAAGDYRLVRERAVRLMAATSQDVDG